MINPNIREIFNSSQDFETKIEHLQPQVDWKGRKFKENDYQGTIDFKMLVRGTIDLFQKPDNNLNPKTKQKIVDHILKKNDEANRQLEKAPLYVKVITFFRRVIGNIGFDKEAEINKLISLANEPEDESLSVIEAKADDLIVFEELQNEQNSLEEQVLILKNLYKTNQTEGRQEIAKNYFLSLFEQIFKNPENAPLHLDHIRSIIREHYDPDNPALARQKSQELKQAAESAFQAFKLSLMDGSAPSWIHTPTILYSTVSAFEEDRLSNPYFSNVDSYIENILNFLQNRAELDLKFWG